MKKAILRIPKQFKATRRVWIGCYGGHFDIVVVFSSKPKKEGKESFAPGAYCSDVNAGIIAGTFDLDTFNLWFGTSLKAEDTEIMSVEVYELTALWDGKRIFGLITNAD